MSVRAAIIALGMGFLAVPTAWAADVNAYPTRPLLDTEKTIIGETITYPTTGPARVSAAIVTIAPNAETVFHRHGVPMFAYIQKGTVVVDYGDKGPRTYHPGDAFVEAMATTHRGTNPGTEPVEILVVYMGAEGSANVVPVK